MRISNGVIEIKPTDRGFKFIVEKVEFPRAAIAVEENCPPDVRLNLQQWVSNGWITPVAYIKEKDFIWEKLKE